MRFSRIMFYFLIAIMSVLSIASLIPFEFAIFVIIIIFANWVFLVENKDK